MEAGELGSGGKGVVVEASEVDFAATMTVWGWLWVSF